MQWGCRGAYSKYIISIIGNTDDPLVQSSCNKKYYSYVKSLRRDSSGVAPLKKDGIVYSDGMKKAEILNDQFSSVYTREDSPPPTDLSGPSSYPDMPSISVHVSGAVKLLNGHIMAV